MLKEFSNDNCQTNAPNYTLNCTPVSPVTITNLCGHAISQPGQARRVRKHGNGTKRERNHVSSPVIG